jgi:hypothetical protein
MVGKQEGCSVASRQSEQEWLKLGPKTGDWLEVGHYLSIYPKK